MFRRDDYVADYLNDSITGNAILDADLSETIDFDTDQTAESSNIDAQGLAFEQSWEINLLNLSVSFLTPRTADTRTWNMPFGMLEVLVLLAW